MVHAVIDRADGKLLRAYTHPESDAQHPSEVEIRLLSADYFGNHIRSVEKRAYYTEKDIGDALEALVLTNVIENGGKRE